METLWAEIGRSRRFSKGVGWVTLSAYYRKKGASPTNHCWCQSSRVITLSCGVKIFAVRHLVLSQSTRVTDGQTDRQTNRRTDRITTPKTALAYARAVKIKVNKQNFLNFAFPTFKFSQKNTNSKFHKVVWTHYVGEVENIYNALWQMYSGH